MGAGGAIPLGVRQQIMAEGSAVALLSHIHTDMVTILKDVSLPMETRVFAQATAKNIQTWSADSGLIAPDPAVDEPIRVSVFGTPGRS